MKDAIEKFLKEINYNGLDNEEQMKRIKEWKDLYKGKTKDYKYCIYNGQKRINREFKTLSIIPQSCNDIADFFINEKLDIQIDNESIDKKIKECLEQNNFLEKANKLLQLTMALGTGAIVPYLDNGVLRLNYINADNIYILKYNNTGIIDILFATELKTNDGSEITLNAHILTDKGYVIYNRKYKVNKNNTSEIQIDKSIREIPTGSYVPRFAIITTAMVNNIDIESPYGISVYANAKDIVLSLDRAYDSLDNEIAIGRKRVYVPQTNLSINIGANGETTPAFDTNDSAFYTYPGKENDKLVESSFELRVEPITECIQANLDLYSSKVGLGKNYYRFKDGQTYVNTENVMATNSDTFRKIRKQENILTRAFKELIYAIAELLGIKEQFSVSIDYDDTIIEDTDKVQRTNQSEYSIGLISPIEYYQNVYKMSEENALEYAKKVREHKLLETQIDGVDLDEE